MKYLHIVPLTILITGYPLRRTKAVKKQISTATKLCLLSCKGSRVHQACWTIIGIFLIQVYHRMGFPPTFCPRLKRYAPLPTLVLSIPFTIFSAYYPFLPIFSAFSVRILSLFHSPTHDPLPAAAGRYRCLLRPPPPPAFPLASPSIYSPTLSPTTATS